MTEWYSARKVAEIMGITERSVQRIAARSKWKFQDVAAKGGPRGKRREYHISALPETARMALIERHSDMSFPSSPLSELFPPPGNGTMTIPSRGSSLPVDPTGRRASARLHAPISIDHIPEKARRIALARMDLVRLWQDYRNTHRKATDADKEFESAYNAGALFPSLFAILGNVSYQTLYRWKATIGETQDWTNLVPQYYYKSSDKPRLTPEEEYVFMGLLLNEKKIKIGSAIRLLKYHFALKGVTVEKSDMTFRRFAESYKTRRYDRWVLMREGQKALADKVNFTIKRNPALLGVGEVLVADGHRLNFQVINPFTGKPARAVLVGYLDWKSWDLVGYEIMLEENTQCIASAFRNSLLRLGKYPKVLYLDNGKAFRARFFTRTETFDEEGIYGLFARLGVIPIFAKPYNARAKVIERWFQEFTNTFERLLPSFTGASIADKPAHMMRNEKFHKALHKEYIPTIPEAIELIGIWHEFLRSQPCPHVKGKTIGQVFDEGKGPGIDPAELNDLMMAVEAGTIGRNGIRFLSADYYDDTLYGLREKIIIRYSLFDLSAIKVYLPSGECLCEATRVEEVHPIARISGTALDMETLKRSQALQASLAKKTIKGVKELAALGKNIEMDWQKVIDVTPDRGRTLIGALDEAGIQLPAIEEHIPAEAVQASRFDVQGLETATAMENNSLESASNSRDLQKAAIDHAVQNRPFFNENYERFDWHLKYGIHTEEDAAWIAWYKTTGEYKMIYDYFEKQNAEMREQQKTL